MYIYENEIFMTEEWKDIKEYEGLYQVSNLGRVKSLKFGKEKILKLSNNKGYIQVTLYNDVIRKTYKVHRLVAETFLPNSDNKPCIDHINTNRTDNRVENLRWCTYKENMNNLLTKEKITINNYNLGKIGKEHYSSKPVLQYDKNGNFINEWDSMSDVERELKIYKTNISNCCKGKINTAGGYIWRYKLCG